MGLTISNWGNVSTRLGNPQQGIASDDWAALGKGIGGAYRWKQRQKAADMMESKANVQDRIKAIDAEIAELEGKLKGLEEEQAKEQAARDEANQQAMEENLWNSYLRENAKPTEYAQPNEKYAKPTELPQPKGGMMGNDYVAAMNKANAMRERAGMGGYETTPTDPDALQAAQGAGQMLNYHPTYGGRVAQPKAGTLSPDYVAEENQVRQNAMAALDAQRKYRWGR